MPKTKSKRKMGAGSAPKYCKGKCDRKISHQNKIGYYKEYFCRFILSPKRADASRRDKKPIIIVNYH